MMSKGARAATKIINEFCITEPNEYPIEDIIVAKNIFFQTKPMKGSDGRIIFGKNNAIITVNDSITFQQKRRFVAAHELGHYELHKSLERFYNCTEADFMKWDKEGNHEIEANEFAAELLMPEKVFKKQLGKNEFKIDLIKSLANTFCTSITSTAIRFTEIGNYPMGLIYSENGKIRWYRRSEDFTCKYFKVKDRVPIDSVANSYFKTGKVPTEPEVVSPFIWFNDFHLKPDQYFYEQCFPIPSLKGVLSFVWDCYDY